MLAVSSKFGVAENILYNIPIRSEICDIMRSEGKKGISAVILRNDRILGML